MKKYKISLLAIMSIVGFALTGCGDNNPPTNGNQAAQRDETLQQSQSDEPTETTNNGMRVEQTAELEEIGGNIISFNEQGVQIEKSIRFEAYDGSEVGVTGTEDNETINVFFNENTQFELIVEKRISNTESERLEQRVASVDDMESNPAPTLKITGVWQNEDFIAHSVIIWRTVE